MNPEIDPWHFKRTELAQRYLGAFGLGLQSAWGMFAKRRMGKTEFLNKDLLPAARAGGYIVAYANLWEDKAVPAKVIVAALAAAIEPKGVAKFMERLNTPVRKIKASGKLAGGEAGLEAELAVPAESLASSLLSETLLKFDKTGKRLLIAIDEAQVLASKEHSDFAHALRAGLDTRKHSIKVMFAGSSESTLRRMFGRAGEPFYNWAPLQPFELLGQEFVQGMVERVNSLSRFPLALPVALDAFDALNRTPDFFRRFLNRYLTHAELGAQHALEETKAEVFNDLSFVNVWNSLLEADRAVLRLLATGVKDLHGKAARKQLGAALGLGSDASMNTPAQALRRLQADSLITRMDQGEYAFEDEAFAQWIRSLP